MPFNRFEVIRLSLKENFSVGNIPGGRKHEYTKQTPQLTVKHFYFAQMEESSYVRSHEQVAPPGVAWMFTSQCDGLCSSQSSVCGTFQERHLADWSIDGSKVLVRQTHGEIF